jgi:hypothetical protein
MLWAHQVANGSVSQGLNRHDSKAQITNPLAVLHLVDSCTFAQFRRAQPPSADIRLPCFHKGQLAQEVSRWCWLAPLPPEPRQKWKTAGFAGGVLAQICQLVEQQACESEQDHGLKMFKN